MRRLNEEHGGIVLLFGVLLAFLFVAAALVANVGRAFFERRELQNGADAAALAIAFDCARAVANPSLVARCSAAAAAANASGLPNANAKDGTSTISQVLPATLNPASGSVTVNTVSRRPDGDPSVQLALTRSDNADMNEITVKASASARWGPASAASGFPLLLQQCNFMAFGGAARLPAVGPFPPDDAAPAIIINRAQPPCPEPAHPPGSHGWLTPDVPGGCDIFLAVGATPTSTGNTVSCVITHRIDTGAPIGSGAGEQAAELARRLYHKVVFIPIGTPNGSGSGGSYTVTGWGAIYITGYNFGGQYVLNAGTPNCLATSSAGSARCIRGYFVNAEPQSGAVGSGASFGAQVVQLAK